MDTKKKAKRVAAKTKRAKKTKKPAQKQAELVAKEKATQKTEEAEGVLRSPIDFDQVKQFEEHLKQVENINEELRAGKIGTKEAIQRLTEISERIGR